MIIAFLAGFAVGFAFTLAAWVLPALIALREEYLP